MFTGGKCSWGLYHPVAISTVFDIEPPPSPFSTSVIPLLAIVRRTATKQSLAQGKAFDPNLGPMADDGAQMPMVEISSGNLHHLTGCYLSG